MCLFGAWMGCEEIFSSTCRGTEMEIGVMLDGEWRFALMRYVVERCGNLYGVEICIEKRFLGMLCDDT